MILIRRVSDMAKLSTADRLDVFKTNYGRSAGWLVEHSGHPIALLTDYEPLDMFLDSYRIEPIPPHTEEARKCISSAQFWHEGNFSLRSRQFNELAPHAVVLGFHGKDKQRVKVRGLYLPISKPRLWEKLLLWWKSQVKKPSS